MRPVYIQWFSGHDCSFVADPYILNFIIIVDFFLNNFMYIKFYLFFTGSFNVLDWNVLYSVSPSNSVIGLN